MQQSRQQLITAAASTINVYLFDRGDWLFYASFTFQA
jgi:hypothetical protein